MPTVADIIAVLERFAPGNTAASWDNVGLLLGDRAHPADKILTCLTLTPDVAEEAVAKSAQLIVTHHPILFRGVKRITADTAEGRTILKLAKADVAVHSPHTAFDDCPGGINDQLVDMLGLTNVKPLRAGSPDECKFVVFVPDADLAKVADAIFAAGAGGVGHYRECSNRFKGTGTFFGDETTHPAVGQRGRRE
jgi:dinuclear metal center YbgI/SA1388 family protein